MKLAIQICAELEWICIKSILKIPKNKLQFQPFGEYFKHPIGKHKAIIFESGATKTRAAAACQFAVDTWKPDVVINLGTCGGVAPNLQTRDIILANKTIQYDVIQRFGKPSPKFLQELESDHDLSWVDLGKCGGKIHLGMIASADQDLYSQNRMFLHNKRVLAADWESASIALVCRLNKIKCLILRGVSDIPSGEKQTQDVQEQDYRKNTRTIMENLLKIIGQIKCDS